MRSSIEKILSQRGDFLSPKEVYARLTEVHSDRTNEHYSSFRISSLQMLPTDILPSSAGPAIVCWTYIQQTMAGPAQMTVTLADDH